ncbi:hypothetical protein C8R47DRAFT_1137098 [Mycena vitilis]|nr:hypothetical protein C8R47DRAFT_1137098 [Mycena vitilis]
MPAPQPLFLQSRGIPQPLFLESRGMRLIYKVLANPTIFGLFFTRLNSLGVSYKLLRNDLLRVVTDRLEFWQIDPLIADGFWLSARQLGHLLVSAAHGINFAAHAAPAVPIQFPLAAMREPGLPIPTILLALGYPSNPLRHRRYASPEAAVADCLLFVEWYEDNLCWLAECLRRTISNGINTVWNFGTVLDMRKDEFFDGIANSRAEAGLDELDILLSTTEDAPFNYNDLDLDIAAMIRPWYTHLGVVGDATHVGVGLYPIESEFSSPMDRLMFKGFNDMTFEFANMQPKAFARAETAMMEILDFN